MITNICIVVFLLLMAYIWSMQGAFSAFLHLALSVVAGALAFAFWEPAAYLVMKYMPVYAWSIGLVAPFAVSLLIMRIVTDKTIKGRLNFSRAVDTAVGGLCGVLAGILACGILLISIGFIPLGIEIGGYQPFKSFNAKGQPIEKAGNTLWFPCDRWTSGFYTMLSNGAFANNTPLAMMQPNAARQAQAIRLGSNRFTSTVVPPEDITLGQMYVSKVPLSESNIDIPTPIANQLSDSNNKFVIIDSTWKQGAKSPAFIDNTLNITSGQIQLIYTEDGRHYHAAMPIAAGMAALGQKGRTFLPFATDPNARIDNKGARQATFSSIFVLPSNASAKWILFRNNRYELPPESKAVTELDKIAEVTGMMAVQKTAAEIASEEAAQKALAQQSKLGAQSGRNPGGEGMEIKVSADLPAVISKNKSSGLDLRGDENLVVSGNAMVDKTETRISGGNRIERLAVPASQQCVRVMLVRNRAASIFGKAMTSAAQIHPLNLYDHYGQAWPPIGYILYKTKQNTKPQIFKIDPDQPISSGKQLPLDDMVDGDELYLYFFVQPGVQIVSFDFGQAKQDINPPLLIPDK